MCRINVISKGSCLWAWKGIFPGAGFWKMLYLVIIIIIIPPLQLNHKGTKTQRTHKEVCGGLHLCDPCGLPKAVPGSLRQHRWRCPGCSHGRCPWAGPSGLAARQDGLACLTSARAGGRRPVGPDVWLKYVFRIDAIRDASRNPLQLCPTA